MIEKNLEDTILIQNILEGSKKAEQILYDKYKKILTDFLNQKYPYNSECEDDVSEILIKTFLSISDYDPEKSKFKTWIFTIAKNHMIDKSRCSHYINGTITLTDIDDSITIDNSSYAVSNNTTLFDGNVQATFTSSNSADLINFENATSINYVSDQLESCDFSFLNMHYVYGYTYCEIGTEFNVSSNTVSNRVNYIKDKLKKKNSEEFIYE